MLSAAVLSSENCRLIFDKIEAVASLRLVNSLDARIVSIVEYRELELHHFKTF